MEKTKFLPVIGIVIFIIVLLNADTAAMAEMMANADPILLLLVLFLHIPVILMKVGKWKLIIHAHGSSSRFTTCIHAWIVGFIIGIVTPGRIGELTKAYYLKKDTKTGGALSTIIVDRIIDIIILFILAIFGIIVFLTYYVGQLSNDFIYVVIGFFIIFILLVLFILTRINFVKRFAKPIFNKFVPGKYKSRMLNLFNDFYAGLGRIRKRKRMVVISFFMSLSVWLISVLQFKVLSVAMSLDINYLFLLSVLPIITLLDTLPISFSGLGTRELALLFFFGILGISNELTISFSVMFFLFGYIALVPVGLLFWFIKPIKIRS